VRDIFQKMLSHDDLDLTRDLLRLKKMLFEAPPLPDDYHTHVISDSEAKEVAKHLEAFQPRLFRPKRKTELYMLCEYLRS